MHLPSKKGRFATTLLVLPLAFCLGSMRHVSAKAPEVPLLKETEIPIISDGRQVGTMKLKAGSLVTVLSTNGPGLLVTRGEGGSPISIPADSVGKETLAAAMGTPHPLTATIPVSRPLPTPIPPPPAPKASPSPALSASGSFQPRVIGNEMITSSPSGGNVTYTFHMPRDPSPEDLDILRQMDTALRDATACYNRNATGLREAITVRYSPGTPTADGSSNGNIRLGRNARNQRVVMHEIAHTFGVGTSPSWGRLVVNGVFTGRNATQALREATHDPSTVLHADHQHFWPYGLNYDDEVKSAEDFVTHCRIVSAIVRDLRGW